MLPVNPSNIVVAAPADIAMATVDAAAHAFKCGPMAMRRDLQRLGVPVLEVGGREWFVIAVLAIKLLQRTVPGVETDEQAKEFLAWLGDHYQVARYDHLREALRETGTMYRYYAKTSDRWNYAVGDMTVRQRREHRNRQRRERIAATQRALAGNNNQ
jgi:hypothetical protein